MHSKQSYQDEPVADECVRDLPEMQKYIKGSQLTLRYNDEEFD